MTSVIVSNTPPFGAMSNAMVAQLNAVNEQMTRLAAANAAAQSGFSGTAGTEFEGNSTNFGVVANATLGEKGADYAFALGSLTANWATWWTANSAFINAIDNGVPS